MHLSLCPSKHKLSTVVEYQNGQNDDIVYFDTNHKRMITDTGRVIMTIKMTMTEMMTMTKMITGCVMMTTLTKMMTMTRMITGLVRRSRF